MNTNFDSLAAENIENQEVEVFSFDGEVVAEEKKEFNNILLPNGTYPFTVVNIEKKRYQKQNEKSRIPNNCPQVILTLQVEYQGEKALLKENLYYCSIMKWKMDDAFIGCGVAQVGENYNLDPDQLLGKTGMVEVTQRQYKKTDGTEKTRNDVKAIVRELKKDDKKDFGGF